MSQSKLSRRTLFAGASTAGVVAAIANFLPSTPVVASAEATLNKPPPANGGGYTLSDHVKQYYKTARL
jgi:hypothetical protein